MDVGVRGWRRADVGEERSNNGCVDFDMLGGWVSLTVLDMLGHVAKNFWILYGWFL